MPYLNQLETFNCEENVHQENINKNSNKDKVPKLDSKNKVNKSDSKNRVYLDNKKNNKEFSLDSEYLKKEYLKTLNERNLREDDISKNLKDLWDDKYYFKRAENVYVICSDCVSQELIVRAPKNYKMVQNHYFNKNTDYMTLKNINYELEFKKKVCCFKKNY